MNLITYKITLSFLVQPIPDSLSTLLEFTRHMEQALSQNGDGKKYCL